MPTINVPVEYTLNGSGSEIPALSTTDSYNLYIIKGTPVVPSIGSYNITYSGTPYLGMTYKILYRGVLTLGVGATFSLFGTQITQSQLLKTWDAICTWNGSSFNVILHMNFSEGGMVSGTNIGSLAGSVIADGTLDLDLKGLNLSLTTAKIANLAVTTGKIDNLAVTNAKINDVDGSKIAAATVTNAKLATMSNNTIKGNISGGSAIPSDIPISTIVGINTWSLTGNAGTIPGTNFVGTTDLQDLVFKTNNLESGRISIALANTSFGRDALTNVITGDSNVAIGRDSQNLTSTGKGNVSIGVDSLKNNTTGISNVAIGQGAGSVNISGGDNTYIGYDADSDAGGTGAFGRIALGSGAIATSDFQFALPDNVTKWKFRGNSFTLPSADGPANSVLTTNGSKTLSFSSVIDSGTYLPDFVSVANVNAFTKYTCQWMRVGNVVTVSGKVDIDPTATPNDTVLRMSLPVSTNFSSQEECGGTAASNTPSTTPVRIYADTTNNDAIFSFTSGTTSNDSYSFTFTYSVI